jgi:Ca2+-transporting ATPase
MNEQTVTELFVSYGDETLLLDPTIHAFRTPSTSARRALEVGAICNDAVPIGDGSGKFAGQATDVALAAAYAAATPGGPDPRASFTRTTERPFSSETKSMSVSGTHISVAGGASSKEITYVKGAPDALIQRCRAAYSPEGSGPPRALDATARTRLLEQADAMGTRGLRVVALAYAEGPPTTSTGALELGQGQGQGAERTDLVFAGLAGMRDPPRKGAQDAVERLRAGGVRVVMITGDAPATARAIAAELGILVGTGAGAIGRTGGNGSGGADGTVITGAEVDGMSDAALKEVVGRVGVYARTTPKHKMRIVKAWQTRGAVVAMTGDGGLSILAFLPLVSSC